MVKSPCVKICKVTSNNLCDGCYRTVEEISNWSSYSDKEKEIIIFSSKERKKSLDEAKNAAPAN